MNTMSTEAEKQALTTRLVDARNALLALVRGLPVDRLETPGAVGDWSVKDVIGHIASWENRLLTLAQTVLNGHADQIQWLDGDEALQAWNHKQYLRKQAWTWQETIRDLAFLREEVLWNIGWAEPAQLFQEHPVAAGTVSPAALLLGIAEHDQEHLADLQAWAAGFGA